MECKTAWVTVSTAAGDEATESKKAVILVEPVVRAVASPLVPDVLLIAATAVLDELQVAQVVRSCVVVSTRVPVAANCRVNPWGTLTAKGATAIDCTGEEVSVTEPVAPSNAACMVAVPGVEPAVASPFEPVVSLTVPLDGFKDVHAANGVKNCDAPLARVPVAVNCCVVPGAILGGVDGDTAIDDTCDVPRVAVPAIPLETAVSVAVPMFDVAVAMPQEPTALLMVATLASDEFHVADAVMSRVPPFENSPVAVSCTVVPGAMLEFAGETDIDTSVAEMTRLDSVKPVQPCRKEEKSTIVVDRAALIHALHLLVMTPSAIVNGLLLF